MLPQRYGYLLLCLVLATLTFHPAPASSATFQGKWKTNLGTLTIQQDGDQVRGSYGSSGKITGAVSGNTLRGSYTWSTKRGTYELVLDQSGRSFTGKWARTGASGSWSGTRIGAVESGAADRSASPSQTPISQVDLDGTWRVEDAANGRNGDFSPIRWQFSAGGTVNAPGAWRGLWERCGGDRIWVVLIDGNADTDLFEVAFYRQGTEFTAFKNGRDYRYGEKE